MIIQNILEYVLRKINILRLREAPSITQDHWLAGFTDADGCFHVSIIKSPTHSIGYSVRLESKITQKDNTVLKLIQQNFGGCVSFTLKINCRDIIRQIFK